MNVDNRVWAIARKNPAIAKRMSELPAVEQLAFITAKLEIGETLTADDLATLSRHLYAILDGRYGDATLGTKRSPGKKRTTISSRWLVRRKKIFFCAYYLWLAGKHDKTEAKAQAAEKARVSERTIDTWLSKHRAEAKKILPSIIPQCEAGELHPEMAIVIPRS